MDVFQGLDTRRPDDSFTEVLHVPVEAVTEMDTTWLDQRMTGLSQANCGCGSTAMGSHLGGRCTGAPPILVYFSGDWD